MSWSDSAARVNAAQLRVFGEVVQYQGSGGAGLPVNVTVIWSAADTSLPKGVSATAWTLESNLDPLPAKNDVLMRGGDRYRVVDPADGVGYQRDGQGGLTLFLRVSRHTPNV